VGQGDYDIRGKKRSANPALRRLRQEDGKFEANLGYIVRSCLKRERKEGRREEGMEEKDDLALVVC
jgi:hypothetical protein